MVGFSDGNGTLTTGGSNGNMIGMMCARYIIDPLGNSAVLIVEIWLVSCLKNHTTLF